MPSPPVIGKSYWQWPGDNGIIPLLARSLRSVVDAERGRRAGKKELDRFGRRRIILIRAQAPIFGGLLDCFNLGYLVSLNQTAKPSNAPNVGAFYCPRVGERTNDGTR